MNRLALLLIVMFGIYFAQSNTAGWGKDAKKAHDEETGIGNEVSEKHVEDEEEEEEDGEIEAMSHKRRKFCYIWGDPHYTTFDKLQHHFQGRCSYYLVTPCNKKAKGMPFEIIGSNINCGRGVTCERYVRIVLHTYPKTVIKMSGNYKGGIETWSTGAVKPLSHNRKYKIKATGKFKNAGYYKLRVGRGRGRKFVFELTYGRDLSYPRVVLKMNRAGNMLHAELVPAYFRKSCGLCGWWNGNKRLDLKTSTGQIVPWTAARNRRGLINKFGNSWLVSPKFAQDKRKRCTASNKRSFCDKHPHLKAKVVKKCKWVWKATQCTNRKAITKKGFMDDCVIDTCTCAKRISDIGRCAGTEKKELAANCGGGGSGGGSSGLLARLIRKLIRLIKKLLGIY